MKEQEKIDRRVKRTKKVLTEALIRILKNKNIENVTVSELAKEADITRTTFYQYYRDPIEMLENLQKDIARDLEKIVEKTEGGRRQRIFRPSVYLFLSGQDKDGYFVFQHPKSNRI